MCPDRRVAQEEEPLGVQTARVLNPAPVFQEHISATAGIYTHTNSIVQQI